MHRFQGGIISLRLALFELTLNFRWRHGIWFPCGKGLSVFGGDGGRANSRVFQGVQLHVPGHVRSSQHGGLPSALEHVPRQDIHHLFRRLVCQNMGYHTNQEVSKPRYECCYFIWIRFFNRFRLAASKQSFQKIQRRENASGLTAIPDNTKWSYVWKWNVHFLFIVL